MADIPCSMNRKTEYGPDFLTRCTYAVAMIDVHAALTRKLHVGGVVILLALLSAPLCLSSSHPTSFRQTKFPRVCQDTCSNLVSRIRWHCLPVGNTSLPSHGVPMMNLRPETNPSPTEPSFQEVDNVKLRGVLLHMDSSQ